ncbi:MULTISPECIES: energy-coupling factor transporter transmembrane protein EcfT [unclassified Ruminococcus]|uniref:energy-coupling factor transporter transmembrane component T family protein n=1 Tax=unclassified Ruminococcus TaxID=2608920 RepID=UPI002108CEE2|nr:MULTISPECIES: energy-coupling factor transporter transmembrane component T [unclassified Ruminococcus]MCQ4022139.1 energy-coupling factor transporter transmembrane protein EcfT [Ruminococcus sp. zg-924]MCQ4114459.1 energy-coupling factor transporter transmembrane protein EcfT [Ruminococcus sp. zg-921]
MLKDITLGQFLPGDSPVHRLDPRAKILLLIAVIVFIFITGNYISLALVGVFIIAVILFTKISLKMYLKSMKMILFIVLFTGLINLFYGKGEPLVQLGIFTITEAGINNAIFVTVRIALLILASSVLTFTTSPTDLTDAVERLLKPLTVFHIKVHEVAMMMTIALRFVPTLLEETDKIMSAQKARGADMDSGNLIKRVKALIPVLIPLFLSAFRRASDLAIAMECRCYQGGSGRTRMKTLHYGKIDAYGAAICLVLLTGVILCNIFLPATVR